MNFPNRLLFWLLLPCCITIAGEPDIETDAPVLPEEKPWLTPSVNIRTRYEFRSVDPFEDSQALTTRLRGGLLTREVFGLSAFGELEATTAIVDDYRSNPADASTDPHVPNNTVIGDPENFELNQAWLQYHQDAILLRVGRQRIIRNNAAFVAHVGWRQNEQTYDAVNLEYDKGPLRASYAYSNRALRVFGDDANDAPPGAPLLDFDGDFHFLDILYEEEPLTVGTYLYSLDVENSNPVGESHSLGGFVKAGPWRAELAYQFGESSLVLDRDYGAFYGHLTFTQTIGDSELITGVEYLQENFKTPFALLHAFNGFADVFVMQRAGLNDAGGAYQGLTDTYLGYVRKGLPYDLTFKGYGHVFMDDQVGDVYGYEADAVLEKAFTKNIKGILTGAYFVSEGESGFPDTTQVTAELNFSF
ncbi:MAG: alginate export family protein [Verrucomicrobiales bacterium]